MAIARFSRVAKRSYKSYGFCVKLSAVVILGLCFVFFWSVFSPSSLSVTTQRETFDEFAEPVSGNGKKSNNVWIFSDEKETDNIQESREEKKKTQTLQEKEKSSSVSGSIALKSEKGHKIHEVSTKEKQKVNSKPHIEIGKEKIQETEGSEDEDLQEEKQEEDVSSKDEETVDGGEGNAEGDSDLVNGIELDQDDNEGSGTSKKNKRKLGPIFDPKAHYTWKLCSSRSKHNYIPCIDIEISSGKLQSYRHHERSCPKIPLMCLVQLPRDGYEPPIRWPESKGKVWNVTPVQYI